MTTTWDPDDDAFFEQWSGVQFVNLARPEDESQPRNHKVDFYLESSEKLAFKRDFAQVPQAGDVLDIVGDILQLEIQSVSALPGSDGKNHWSARFLWRC